MKLKRFVAADMHSAMNKIRSELGDDAVIWSSNKLETGVEVIAATEYDDEVMEATEEVIDDEITKNSNPSSHKTLAKEHADAITIGAMQSEISSLRTLLEDQLADLVWDSYKRRTPIHAGLLRKLDAMSVEPQLAQDLIGCAQLDVDPNAAWHHLYQEMTQRVQVTGDNILSKGGLIALMGTTGVGKTTTIAKLAAQFALRHGANQVALITTDAYRVAAHEQLRTYGKIMEVPVRVVSTADELRVAVNKFSHKKLILIDTAGMGQRDNRINDQITLLKQGAPKAKYYLVVSATSQRSVMNEEVKTFRKMPLSGCVLTKLDDAISLGDAITVLMQQRLPVAYVGVGQKVPKDLRVACSKEIIDAAVSLVDETLAADEQATTLSKAG